MVLVLLVPLPIRDTSAPAVDLWLEIEASVLLSSLFLSLHLSLEMHLFSVIEQSLRCCIQDLRPTFGELSLFAPVVTLVLLHTWLICWLTLLIILIICQHQLR